MKGAADYLGVSLRVIRNLVEQNAFPVIPLAGVIRIRRATLDAWLESQEVYRSDNEAFKSARFKQPGKADLEEADDEK
jgi:excisionase family DNA binding protein